MKTGWIFTAAAVAAAALAGCREKGGREPGPAPGDGVTQVAIPRIEKMDNMPVPYKIIDWKRKALEFDNYAFDFDSSMPAGPIIWLDDAQRNVPQQTFGQYTAIHDVRQGPEANGGEFHESLTSLAAILGGGLNGIDKTNQNGYNFVKMVQNYFNSDNGWNIVMINTNPDVANLGGGYGRDWWYDVLPNCLYYAVSDVFPGVPGAEEIQRTVAEQFYRAGEVLGENYDYSYFDYGTMTPHVNHIPLQQDAAGGHGYVLYSAYRKFGDERYLEGAKQAIRALDNQKESRFYEILLPLGIYTAARLNAEEGTDYDTEKMINWVFDGVTDPKGRYGWGIIQDRWGPYDVSGLQGSITDGGGYAFFMNSVKMVWPLLPMVKYEPQYARAIGKWMNNNVSACRLFYPDEIPAIYQWLPQQKDITRGVIAYEGLRKTDDYGKPELKGMSPVAIGDGPKWNEANPPESMFSVYSTAPVGILGATVHTTDVEGVLRLDANATDFYADKPYPVWLIYNPYEKEVKITYDAGEGADLYDVVAREYVARDAQGRVKITIPADTARLVYELPTGTVLTESEGRITTDTGHVILY